MVDIHNNSFMERLIHMINSRKFTLFFFGYILIVMLVIAITKPIHCDAQDHASMGHAILNGLWPGIDYMPHSSFLLQYLYYGIFAVFFNMNLYLMRLCSVIFIFILIVFFWVTMSRLRYNHLTRVLAVSSLVMPAYFSMFYIEFIHYSLTCAFLGYAFLSAFYFLRPGLSEGKMSRAIFFTGFLYGISAATRVHILVMTPVFMGIVMYRYVSIINPDSKTRHFKTLAVLFLGILAANIPNVLILTLCYEKILYSYTTFLPLLFWGWKVYFENNSILWLNLKELVIFLRDPGQLFLFSLFIVAFFLSILKIIQSTKMKKRLQDKIFFPVSCVFFSVPLLIIYWYFGMFRYYYSHLLFIWACASVLVFDYLSESSKIWHAFALRAIIISFLLGASAFGGRAVVYSLRFQNSYKSIAAYYKAAEMIKKYTKIDDIVLSATAMPVVLSGRKPYHNGGFPRSSFFWYCLKADTPEMAVRVYPKTIFSKAVLLNDIESGNIPYLLVDYQMRIVGDFFDLSSILKKRYRLLDMVSGYELYAINDAL